MQGGARGDCSQAATIARAFVVSLAAGSLSGVALSQHVVLHPVCLGVGAPLIRGFLLQCARPRVHLPIVSALLCCRPACPELILPCLPPLSCASSVVQSPSRLCFVPRIRRPQSRWCAGPVFGCALRSLITLPRRSWYPHPRSSSATPLRLPNRLRHATLGPWFSLSLCHRAAGSTQVSV